MLPCTQIPPLHLGPLQVYPFAILVAFGVVLAHWLAVRIAGRRGLRSDLAARLGLAMVAAGFAGAWLFHMIYQPGATRGIASFGGIFGGLAGAWLYGRCHWTGRKLLQYLDLFACAFPLGWMFGRAGCTLARDHLGRAGGWWFTVDCGAGPRYNLGFIELLYMVPVAVLLLWVSRKPKPPGFALGLFLAVYGPFRFLLDRLHENPPQLLFWSVDQWSGFAAALIGAGMLWSCRRTPAGFRALRFTPKLDGLRLTPAQQDMMMESASGPWCMRTYLQVDAATGCRRGELLALRWSDLVGGRAMIARSLTQTRDVLDFKCTKTEKPRPVTLPASALTALEAHRRQQDEFRRQFGPDYRTDLDLVFANPDGTPLKPDSVSATVSALFKRLKIPKPKGAALHILRHTHASHLLANGVPLPVVSTSRSTHR